METNQDNFNAKIDGITRLTDSVCDPESNYNSHRHSATSADLLRKLKVYRCWLVSEQIELIRYRDEELEPLFGGNGIDFREDTIECRRYGFIQANLGKIEEIEPIVNGAITRLEQYLQTLVPVVTQSETTALSLLQQLKTNLNDVARGQLFDELIQGGFIDNNTDKASFLWALGGSVPPAKFKPLKWMKTDALLVYLIYALCNDPLGVNNHWVAGQEIFGVMNMAKKRDRYYNNKNGKPNGSEVMDGILSRIKGGQ